jgi:hypothetical protein
MVFAYLNPNGCTNVQNDGAQALMSLTDTFLARADRALPLVTI